MARNSSLLNSLRASPDPIARKAAEAIEGVSQEVDALNRRLNSLNITVANTLQINNITGRPALYEAYP
jgi:hypothetical protein